jgi:D-3-phosphoglycerate dehydrogenase
MKSFSVTRLNISPYQHPDFINMEQSLLESLPGIKYYKSLSLSDLKPTILITNTHTVLNQLPLPLLEQTKLIIHPNSGYDHFEPDQNLWKNIPVVIGHKIRAQAVAEYTLRCLFEGLCELPQHVAWNRARLWDRLLLKEMNVCIFGHGHIGKIVASTLQNLGMNIRIVDPFKPGCASSWREIELKKMQVVISCLSLNKTSRHLFNQEFFENAHPNLLFINGARGDLVDENALKEFLLSHPNAFAFLDVFESEPFTEEWHHFPQVWKTSHVAGVHTHLDQDILKFEYDVLNDYLNISEREFMIKYNQELLQNKWIQGVLI